MKVCAIIPSCNHYKVIGEIISKLRSAGLPVFVIDDGSSEPARTALAQLKDVTLHRLEVNQGKGAAVMTGFRLAAGEGFTHALQVDADGQHDLSVLPQMLELARIHSDALISGKPVYDSSIPLSRKIGRQFCHLWVYLETLSFRVSDSMCGVRIYPLAQSLQLMDKVQIGTRMDFDTEIMVRLYWQGSDVLMVPVKVTYPPGNTSNFDVWRDNIRMVKMHTILVLTMLFHLPGIIRHRRQNKSGHWARIGEVGTIWGLKFCALTYHYLGRRAFKVITAPIVFYFYLTAAKRRRNSRDYLTRVLGRRATFWEGYKHFMTFAIRILDSFIVWTGDIPAESLRIVNQEKMIEMFDSDQGVLIVIAHFGNVELARGLHDRRIHKRMITMSHTKNAQNFNRIMREFHPEAVMDIIQVTEIGPETIIKIKERVENGAWASIAGDRTPVTGKERNTLVPFLGEPAPFAQGPWIMASLLECPVYLLFCVPEGKNHVMTMEKFADQVILPRKDREGAIRDYAARYAARLEEYVRKYPYQWFNFYDFWQE